MQPWTSALVGGALIGVAASIYLLSHGRVSGISGLLGGLFVPATPDKPSRAAFLIGLLVAGLGLRLVHPAAFGNGSVASLGMVAVAGLLVGYGTRLGNGCTSGHGICGITRLSVRSLVATGTFTVAGMVAVTVLRLASGGK